MAASGGAGDGPSGPSPLQQLLAAAAAAHRQLDAQVSEAESGLAQRQADLATAQADIDSTKPEVDGAKAAVTSAATRLAQADDALPALVTADATLSAATHQRTTPVGYPPPAGHTARDEAARAHRALADASLRRDQASAALDAARGSLALAERRAEEARARQADIAAEIDQRANALAGLRQQLAASDASAAPGNAWVGALTAEGGEAAEPSGLAVSDIPADYLDLYRRSAAACPGLSWTVLAAIGAIESSHGRSSAPGVHSGASFAGAKGPMQFLDGTWAAYGADGNSDGTKDVYEPTDAIAGAAAYLCASGGGQLVTLAGAIWDYNHADWYVAAVIQLAAAYGGAGLEVPGAAVDAASLVDNPNLVLSPEARADLVAGNVDPRVVDLLAAAVAHHRITVSVVKAGHDKYVAGTARVSNHYACDGCPGRAVDISAVDGTDVTASNAAALGLALSILTAEPPLKPDEFGSPWPELSRFPGGFSDDDHQNHLHVGWSANT